MPQSSDFLLQPVSAAESGQKLLQFLTRRFTQAHGNIPPSMVHRWIRTGQIRCNGKRCKAFQHVMEGDTVRLPPFALPLLHAQNPRSAALSAPNAQPSLLSLSIPDDSRPETHTAQSAPHSRTHSPHDKNTARPTAPSLPALPPLVHETADLLVFNKISGLPVHPGTGHSDSLSTRLHAHYAGAAFSPTPAHRLDKETSGLLLTARTYTMLRFLQEAFADHRMGKEYLAWVDGLWPLNAPPQELCDKLAKHYTGAYAKVERHTAPPLARSALTDPAIAVPDHSPHNRPPANTAASAAASTTDSTTARAIMHCVEQRGQRSLMHIRLLTGKTHQIRVQLASRGFPLCGDVKYGSAGRPPFKLHAMRLILPPLPPHAHGGPEHAPSPLCLECLPPWQGPWRVDHLPQPLMENDTSHTL